MNRAFKLRLAFSFMLLLFVTLALVGLAVTQLVNTLLTDSVSGRLYSEAELIGGMIKGHPITSDSAELKRVTSIRMTRLANPRVTIIQPDGTVVADSMQNPALMDNHANRQEVAKALLGISNSSVRDSATLKQKMMYVAVPVIRNGRVEAVVRLSVQFDHMKSFLHRVWLVIFTVILLAMLLAALVSWSFVNRLTRPLFEVADVARAIAGGDFERRVYCGDNDEFGLLAEAVNTMAEGLGDQIRQISEMKSRLETVLGNTVNGVVLLDVEGRILFINQAAGRLYGIDPDESGGKRLLEAIHSYELYEATERAKQEQTTIRDVMIVRSGWDRTVEMNVVPIVNGDDLYGVLLVMNDITELKRLETIRRDFVANVSHELKTPVAAISGFAETLLEESDNDTVREFSGIIYDEAQRMARLIGSLLELSQIESSDGVLKKSEFDLKTCAASVMERFEQAAGQKMIQIELRGPETLMITADEDRIIQVLVNLIDNAVYYSPAESKVSIELTGRSKDVLIEVRDQGIGISPDDQQRIFERFYRADKARTRKEGRTGLGLSIVKHIVEAHGGYIAVSSTPGSGSVFHVVLPKS